MISTNSIIFYCICAITLNLVFVGTFCGVFRRQALDRGALLVKADKIVTGKSFYLSD